MTVKITSNPGSDPSGWGGSDARDVLEYTLPITSQDAQTLRDYLNGLYLNDFEKENGVANSDIGHYAYNSGEIKALAIQLLRDNGYEKDLIDLEPSIPPKNKYGYSYWDPTNFPARLQMSGDKLVGDTPFVGEGTFNHYDKYYPTVTQDDIDDANLLRSIVGSNPAFNTVDPYLAIRFNEWFDIANKLLNKKFVNEKSLEARVEALENMFKKDPNTGVVSVVIGDN